MNALFFVCWKCGGAKHTRDRMNKEFGWSVIGDARMDNNVSVEPKCENTIDFRLDDQECFYNEGDMGKLCHLSHLLRRWQQFRNRLLYIGIHIMAKSLLAFNDR